MTAPFRIVGDPGRAPVLAPLATDPGAAADLERRCRAVRSPFAGGAIVVERADPDAAAALARALDGLGGRVLAMPGPAVPWDFFAAVADATPHTLGRDVDTSRATALGVLEAIRGGLGGDLAGTTAAVLGVGRVGRVLCDLLAEAGAHLVVADLAPVKVPGAEVVAPADLLDVPCDVVSPNARGVAITAADADRVRARLVAGGANAPLGPGAAAALARRGVRVIPEEVAASGWLLALEAEHRARVAAAAPALADLLPRIRDLARTAG